MNWTQGQVFVCTRCECEVTVTQQPTNPGRHEDRPPTCCCGHEMLPKRLAATYPAQDNPAITGISA